MEIGAGHREQLLEHPVLWSICLPKRQPQHANLAAKPSKQPARKQPQQRESNQRQPKPAAPLVCSHPRPAPLAGPAPPPAAPHLGSRGPAGRKSARAARRAAGRRVGGEQLGSVRGSTGMALSSPRARQLSHQAAEACISAFSAAAQNGGLPQAANLSPHKPTCRTMSRTAASSLDQRHQGGRSNRQVQLIPKLGHAGEAHLRDSGVGLQAGFVSL